MEQAYADMGDASTDHESLSESTEGLGRRSLTRRGSTMQAPTSGPIWSNAHQHPGALAEIEPHLRRLSQGGLVALTKFLDLNLTIEAQGLLAASAAPVLSFGLPTVTSAPPDARATFIFSAVPPSVRTQLLADPRAYIPIKLLDPSNAALLLQAHTPAMGALYHGAGPGALSLIKHDRVPLVAFKGSATDWAALMAGYTAVVSVLDPGFALALMAHVQVVVNLAKSLQHGQWLAYDELVRQDASNPVGRVLSITRLFARSSVAVDSIVNRMAASQSGTPAQSATGVDHTHGRDNGSQPAKRSKPSSDGERGGTPLITLAVALHPLGAAAHLAVISTSAIALPLSCTAAMLAHADTQGVATPLIRALQPSTAQPSTAERLALWPAGQTEPVATSVTAATSVVATTKPLSTGASVEQASMATGLVWAIVPPPLNTAPAAPVPVTRFSWRNSPASFGSFESPVVTVRLAYLLRESHFNEEEITFLFQGFQRGFDLGLTSNPPPRYSARNLPSAFITNGVNGAANIYDHIVVEAAKRRLLGPFRRSPAGFKYWRDTVVSPLGQVPKADGKLRRIFHLSYGYGPNACIPQVNKTTVYPSFLEVAHAILKVGLDTVAFALFDIRDAYRLIPIAPDQWKFLVFNWECPTEPGVNEYFVDICLCFGISSGPQLYNRFGRAVQHILEHLLKIIIKRMLDDHLLLGTSVAGVDASLSKALAILEWLGIEVNVPKTIRGTRAIKFLGYWWDAAMDIVSLDPDRWVALAGHLQAVLEFNSDGALSVAQLRSLNGRLSWASKVVQYGKVHTTAMFLIVRLSGYGSAPKRVASRIPTQLSPAAMEDINWWASLCASTGPGRRPPGTRLSTILDGYERAGPNTLTIHTDASGVGIGAWSGVEWIFMAMPSYLHLGETPRALGVRKVSSGMAEAAGVLAALLTWGPRYPNHHLNVFSDSKNVVDGWAAQHSPKPDIIPYLRAFALSCSQFSITMTITHISGELNVFADLISRGQAAHFLQLHPAAQPWPLQPPSEPAVWLDSIASQHS